MSDYSERIEVNPKVMVGKPVIRSTRVPVEVIIQRLKQEWTFDEILKDFPNLTRLDIIAALDYAENLVREEQLGW